MERYFVDFDSKGNEIKSSKRAYSPSVTHEVGDVIVFHDKRIDPETGNPFDPAFRKIAEVRATGYSWFYPELGEYNCKTPSGSTNNWISENSNDEFLERGWAKVKVISAVNGQYVLETERHVIYNATFCYP